MKKQFSALLLALLAFVAASLADVKLSDAPDTRPALESPLLPAPLFAQSNRASVQLVAPYRVTVGVTAVQLTTSGNVNGGVVLKALSSGQTLYVGTSSAVTTATGYPLSDKDTLTLEVRNANTLWLIASAAAQSVAVLPFSRY